MSSFLLVDMNGKPLTEKVDMAIPHDLINLLHNLRNGDGMNLFAAVKYIGMSLVPVWKVWMICSNQLLQLTDLGTPSQSLCLKV